MKKISVKIGEGNQCSNETEANTRFKGMENEINGLKQESMDLKQKLKQGSFSFKEQGKSTNYFQTSNNTIYNPKGNPNEIRSFIPES